MDAKIDYFKVGLIKLINEAELPASVVYYVLKDILLDISEIKDSEIIKQKERDAFKNIETKNLEVNLDGNDSNNEN